MWNPSAKYSVQLIYSDFYSFCSSLFYGYFSSHVTPTRACLLMPGVTGVTVRYATNNRMVYAVYLHPHFRLQRDEVFSALRQVA